MKTTHEKIEFSIGGSIDTAIEQLSKCKQKGILAYGCFNGVELYSDIDDIETAYKKVTGVTKSEFDQRAKEESERYKIEKEEHEAAIPQLTEKWIAKGKEVLDEKYQELWAECVPIRLDDLYRGFELECLIDIAQSLNSGAEFSETKKIIEEQGHSGMSFGLICAMVRSFCDRGHDFVEFINSK